MIAFNIKDVRAIGTAYILPNGNTTQQCMIEIEMTGLKIGTKTFNETVLFEVPNSVVSGQDIPLYTAWMYIKEDLIPSWLNDNYSLI